MGIYAQFLPLTHKAEATEGAHRLIGRRKFLGRHSFCYEVKPAYRNGKCNKNPAGAWFALRRGCRPPPEPEWRPFALRYRRNLSVSTLTPSGADFLEERREGAAFPPLRAPGARFARGVTSLLRASS